MRAAVLLPLLLGACDLSMQRQERPRAQGSAELWQGGPPIAPPPGGTVAQDDPARAAALAVQPPLTPALIARGEERYGIYCAVCHGARGAGEEVFMAGLLRARLRGRLLRSGGRRAAATARVGRRARRP